MLFRVEKFWFGAYLASDCFSDRLRLARPKDMSLQSEKTNWNQPKDNYKILGVRFMLVVHVNVQNHFIFDLFIHPMFVSSPQCMYL
jgi:hypothetical protein